MTVPEKTGPKANRAAPVKTIKANGYRTNGTVLIPEEVNRPLRERLLLTRLARNKTLSDVNSISKGTIHRYEDLDISTMKLGDLYRYSLELGYTLPEMLHSLAGSVEMSAQFSALDEAARQEMLALRYLRLLNEEARLAAVKILEVLVDTNITRSRIKQKITTSVKRNYGEGGGNDDETWIPASDRSSSP